MKIALYNGKTFFGKATKLFSEGQYSHCAIIFDDNTSIEAQPFKDVSINKNPFDMKNYNSIDIYQVPTTKDQDVIIRDFLTRQLGKGYDYPAIVGIVLHASIEGRKAYGKWTCSELVFAAFRKAGIVLIPDVDAWNVTPVMLGKSSKVHLYTHLTS